MNFIQKTQIFPTVQFVNMRTFVKLGIDFQGPFESLVAASLF